MKIMSFVLITVLFAAGAAQASAEISDVDFLRANRCKGLATSLAGVVDPASLDGLIRAERGGRAPYVMERAQDEYQRARREAKAEERKARLTAELTGPCQALLTSDGEAVKR